MKHLQPLIKPAMKHLQPLIKPDMKYLQPSPLQANLDQEPELTMSQLETTSPS